MKKILAIVSIAVMMAACDQARPPVQAAYDAVPNNVQAAAAPQANNGIDAGDAAVGAIAGAAAGYFLGKGSAASNQPRTVIVDRRPTYYGYKDYSRRSTVVTRTTTVSRGLTGRTVTRTTTSRRR